MEKKNKFQFSEIESFIDSFNFKNLESYQKNVILKEYERMVNIYSILSDEKITLDKKQKLTENMDSFKLSDVNNFYINLNTKQIDFLNQVISPILFPDDIRCWTPKNIDLILSNQKITLRKLSKKMISEKEASKNDFISSKQSFWNILNEDLNDNKKKLICLALLYSIQSIILKDKFDLMEFKHKRTSFIIELFNHFMLSVFSLFSLGNYDQWFKNICSDNSRFNWIFLIFGNICDIYFEGEIITVQKIKNKKHRIAFYNYSDSIYNKYNLNEFSKSAKIIRTHNLPMIKLPLDWKKDFSFEKISLDLKPIPSTQSGKTERYTQEFLFAQSESLKEGGYKCNEKKNFYSGIHNRKMKGSISFKPSVLNIINNLQKQSFYIDELALRRITESPSDLIAQFNDILSNSEKLSEENDFTSDTEEEIDTEQNISLHSIMSFTNNKIEFFSYDEFLTQNNLNNCEYNLRVYKSIFQDFVKLYSSILLAMAYCGFELFNSWFFDYRLRLYSTGFLIKAQGDKLTKQYLSITDNGQKGIKYDVSSSGSTIIACLFCDLNFLLLSNTLVYSSENNTQKVDLYNITANWLFEDVSSLTFTQFREKMYEILNESNREKKHIYITSFNEEMLLNIYGIITNREFYSRDLFKTLFMVIAYLEGDFSRSERFKSHILKHYNTLNLADKTSLTGHASYTSILINNLLFESLNKHLKVIPDFLSLMTSDNFKTALKYKKKVYFYNKYFSGFYTRLVFSKKSTKFKYKNSTFRVNLPVACSSKLFKGHAANYIHCKDAKINLGILEMLFKNKVKTIPTHDNWQIINNKKNKNLLNEAIREQYEELLFNDDFDLESYFKLNEIIITPEQTSLFKDIKRRRREIKRLYKSGVLKISPFLITEDK